jgi:hypothetical protein
MPGLQNVRSSKRPVAKNIHTYSVLVVGWWKSGGSVAAMFAGKVMFVFYSLFYRGFFLPYITIIARISKNDTLGNSYTFCLISMSNLKFKNWTF